MEANEYTLEILVREKLAEARAMTARRALVRDSRLPRAPRSCATPSAGRG